jgi:hypothetical protein
MGFNKYDSNQFNTGIQKASGSSGIERPAISISPVSIQKEISGVWLVASIFRVSNIAGLLKNDKLVDANLTNRT